MSLGFAPSQTLLKSSKSADEISPPPTHGLLARTPMWVLDKLADFRYGKELHIYVVRHGQSEGNIDRTLYARQADH